MTERPRYMAPLRFLHKVGARDMFRLDVWQFYHEHFRPRMVRRGKWW
jgi:hypothetical protein